MQWVFDLNHLILLEDPFFFCVGNRNKLVQIFNLNSKLILSILLKKYIWKNLWKLDVTLYVESFEACCAYSNEVVE